MSSGLFYHNSVGTVYFQKQGIWSVFIITMFIEISIYNANSVDPDQTHSLASDLGLHYLPVTILGLSKLKWVKSGTHL